MCKVILRADKVDQIFRNTGSFVKLNKVCQMLWQYEQKECTILRENKEVC